MNRPLVMLLKAEAAGGGSPMMHSAPSSLSACIYIRLLHVINFVCPLCWSLNVSSVLVLQVSLQDPHLTLILLPLTIIVIMKRCCYHCCC